LDNSISNNFIVVASDITVDQLRKLVLKVKPEYIIISRKMDTTDHYRYILLTEAFLSAIQKLDHKPKDRIEDFLELHEYLSDKAIDIPSVSSLADPEYLGTVTKKTEQKGLAILKYKGDSFRVFDQQRGKPDALYTLGRRNFVYRPTTAISPTAGDVSAEILPEKPSSDSGSTETSSETTSESVDGISSAGYSPAPSPPQSAPEVTPDLTKSTIKRYPYCSFPAYVAIDETAPLEVVIKADQYSELVDALQVAIEPGEKKASLYITTKVEPSDAFEFIGNYFAEIIVPTEPIDSAPVLFKLKAQKLGLCVLKILFYQDQGYLGQVEINSQVGIETREGDIVVGKDQNSSGWEIPSPILPPDLLLIIQQVKTSSNLTFDFCIKSDKLGLMWVRVGQISFTKDPETEFHTILTDIESLLQQKNNTSVVSYIEESLNAKGRYLYDYLISPDLKERFWEIRDQIKSITVISEDPWIPWEILKPWRQLGNEIEEEKFLCERYAFSRWLEGIPMYRRDSILKVRVVVPKDTSLQGAKEEASWIQEFAKTAGYTVSENSSFDEVMMGLKTGGFDLLHFSTDGKFDQDHAGLSEIFLQDNIALKAEQVSGTLTTFGFSHPLVILNACQSGQSGFSLTGIGGWAKQFLLAQACGFIGTLWSVSDTTAKQFTESLYEELASGQGIDEAVRLARNKSKVQGDPSWLAYTLYGQPNAKMKLGSQSVSFTS
jgi:hypothetical protein